ncbi:hypothetical protein, conserved [Plasmodium gonderi]|uniref:Uncharacterized protein n=1 Tax=Plasmodium gonderi TaxID=77519 RepID=A0A1Y1JMC3_PLAGO|nr:hypothetical protein, conserved [Plasmodium gonderi]GAW81184.1 hypothetical protein, conserved [Plasmodium gonderi]
MTLKTFKMPMDERDLKMFGTFLNLFKERVNLLQIKSRTEIMVQKKNITFFLLNSKTEKAHENICLMLRNENICDICNKLISLCNESTSLATLSNPKNENKKKLKKCIRNILYSADKLNISNTQNVRTHFIKHFGKDFIEHVEMDYLLLDRYVYTLINKYTFSHKEIAEVQNNFYFEMHIPINYQADQCVCKFCNFPQNDDILHMVRKKDILQIVNAYSTHAESVHDNEKKKIFKEMENHLIQKLNKTLLGG